MVCDRDCFNCVHSDCVQEDITKEERQEITRRDEKYGLAKKRKKSTYYERNKEKVLEYQRNRYHKNIDEQRKRNRERMRRWRDSKKEE